MAKYYRARRYYGGARRSYGWKKTYRKGGFGVGVSTKFLIGVAASFLPVNLPPVANTAAMGIAVAPIKLPYGVKGICQGFVLGKLIQQYTGNPLARAVNTSANTNTGGWY